MEMCKKILKMLRPALIVTLTLMVICGLGYPLLMNGLAGTLFTRQAAEIWYWQMENPLGQNLLAGGYFRITL